MQPSCLGIKVFNFILMGSSMVVSLQYKSPRWVSFSSTLYGFLRGFQHLEILKHISLLVSIVTPGA